MILLQLINVLKTCNVQKGNQGILSYTQDVNYMHYGGICVDTFLSTQVYRIFYSVTKYNWIIKGQEGYVDVGVDRKHPELIKVHPSIDKWESLDRIS